MLSTLSVPRTVAVLDFPVRDWQIGAEGVVTMWMRAACVVAATALMSAPSSAAVLCQKKSGTVVVREACKKKETPLDLAEVVGGSGAIVVDANGKIVGSIADVEAGGGPRVVRRVGDVSLLLRVNAGGFTESQAGFFYESTDCTGQILLPATAGSLFADASVRSGVAYYAAGTPVTFTARSSLGPTLTPGMCFAGTFVPPDLCCTPFPSPIALPAVPATTLDVSTLGLAPPFRVQGF